MTTATVSQENAARLFESFYSEYDHWRTHKILETFADFDRRTCFWLLARQSFMDIARDAVRVQYRKELKKQLALQNRSGWLEYLEGVLDDYDAFNDQICADQEAAFLAKHLAGDSGANAATAPPTAAANATGKT